MGSRTVEELPKGTRVGPYVILNTVPGGIGGMAVVYRAKMVSNGNIVALKVAQAGLGGFLKDETSFLKATNLEHPHIIKILPTPLGGGVSDHIVKDPQSGCWYFAMEFMKGGSLDDWLRSRKQLGLSQSIEVVQQVASALDTAHQSGIIHLDVKPSNILFRKDPKKNKIESVLTDFGIARPKGRIASNQTSLTIEYASPEQARLAQGDAVDVGPASDIYSLAVIFYEMITGHLPFQAQNEVAMLHQIVYEDPRLPETVDQPQMASIIRRALAKDPQERYGSARDFVNDLEMLPRETYDKFTERHNVHPLLSLALGVLIGIGVGAPGGYFIAQQESTPTPQPIVITPTASRVQQEISTATPAAESTTPTPTSVEEPTVIREPTSTPVPATATYTPRPTLPPTSTPATSE
jgi:serine/threonine protein kinase